ncbi:hypothetical protein IT411_01390 [Candidatus Peregrinibacteria bacterium]|nr:hypothetical protein [Candidatus Peregrinibacteria bacterium]
MSGEYIQSNSIKDYWKQLKAFYLASSPVFEKITAKKYRAIERSEREDSDNHLNHERLGEDTQAVDIAFYKYLPESRIAYRVHIVDVNGQKQDHYFIVKSFA